ncbi:MAG TPA: XRE family transcriptional regulator [Methylocystis sp.]|nr:XRE family transcriptional regulator [Methylocystis sp.]
MAKTLDDVVKGLSLDQQQEVAAQATRLIDEEMTLRDLRKAHELTQERMAEALHISQDGVSRLEKRSDFLISTLRSYIEAMGGKLRLVVEFPDRKPVTLSDLDSLDTRPKPRKGKRKILDERAPV